MGTSTAEGTEVFAEVAARADDARCWWVDHLTQPVPADERWGPGTESWAGRVITWFGDVDGFIAAHAGDSLALKAHAVIGDDDEDDE